jgi:hypothetical protein
MFQLFGRIRFVAISTKPRPRERVSLLKPPVTLVAKNDADSAHAEAEKIVYPAMLAGTPATGAKRVS